LIPKLIQIEGKKIMDSNISQLIIQALLIMVLEVALFSDNIAALMSMTSEHSLENQKKLIFWALVCGCPVNFALIFIVIFLQTISWVSAPIHLVLGLALIWVFVKGYQELSSSEDEELAKVESKAHVAFTLSRTTQIVLLLQLQSLVFYFDSVPLASSISQSVLAISIGIMLSRFAIIAQTDNIVNFFSTNKNVQWGVMLFILASGTIDTAEAIGILSKLFEVPELNVPAELSMLAINVILGLMTWRFIDPENKIKAIIEGNESSEVAIGIAIKEKELG
jgi:predicted tellurium resistance membrane protein TerC